MTQSRNQTRAVCTRCIAVVLILTGAGWIAISIGATDSGAQPVRATVVKNDLSAFGVVGDGRTDDTAAIQRAVDAGIGVVRFPKGVYRITKSIVVDLDKAGFTSIHGDGVATIRMEGAGPALKIVGTHFKSADPHGFEDRVWQRQRMPLIDGIAITATHAEADGIEAVGTMQLTITRVHIRKCRHGIRLVKNNRNVIISDSHIYENSGIGIYLDDVNLHQINITGSHISYNGGGGVVSLAGSVRNLHITGCDIESNMSPDRSPTANVLIDCRESRSGTAEVAITGCTIQHNHKAAGSANVRVIGLALPTKRLKRVREGHVTITGNIFSDVHVNVHLQDCRGVTMTGNTFWMGFTHNLLIEKCSNVVMGANLFDRNPIYERGAAAGADNSIVIRDCADCTISGLHVSGVTHDPAAVTVRRCTRMNITGCTILDSGPVGLLLDGLTDSRVSGCLIRDDRADASSVPVKIVGGHGNMIGEDLLAKPR